MTLVASVLDPPLLVAQVVVLVANVVALQAASSEVRGGQRCTEVWVMELLSGYVLELG